MFKKKKIKKYLDNIRTFTTFDLLINDYIQDNLSMKIKEFGVSELEIHVDWLPEYKSITITGLYNQYTLEIQIESHEYTIAIDVDEADDYISYPLDSKDNFYKMIQDTIDKL